MHQDSRLSCDQEVLHLSLLLSDILLLHLLFLSLRCGRCFGSRSPAISPLSLLLLQVQGVDVQPSCRLCSLRAETPRRFATMLQLVMLLLSISCASASSGVRFASAAAAYSLSAGAFVSIFSCASASFVAAVFFYFEDFLVFFRARAVRYRCFFQLVYFFHVFSVP